MSDVPHEEDNLPNPSSTPQEWNDDTATGMEQKSEITIQKSNIKTVEVHHHPDLHHKKKKFTEYFLEFFMIFLAVTMGFLAESLRESRSDHEKEREYISSLVNNLQQDTANLNYAIRANDRKEKGLDSLLMLSFKNLDESVNRQQLYLYCGRYAGFYSAFISNDATMLQLKNSGGLRFIKHHHVADSIAEYDLETRSIYAAETPYAKAMNGALEDMQQLLVYTWFIDTQYYKNGSFTNKKLPLLITDQDRIKIFFNKISDERGWVRNYLDNLREQLPFTVRLIVFLKKEYDLE